MKIESIDNDNFILYLNKDYIKKIDFSNKEKVEEYIKKIFMKLNERINDDLLKGFFDVNIYINDIYGGIFHIIKEDLDYYEYFNNTIEMQVNIINNAKFLYKIDDIFINDIYKHNVIYKYNNLYYVDLKDISISIIEHVNIVFGDIVNTIISKGKKLKINV